MDGIRVAQFLYVFITKCIFTVFYLGPNICFLTNYSNLKNFHYLKRQTVYKLHAFCKFLVPLEIPWSFFLKFIYLFWEIERERERERTGEGQRERERESQADSALSVHSLTCGSIPWTSNHDLSWNQELDALLTKPPRHP